MRVLLGIFFSLLIHFFFVWAAQFAPTPIEKPNSETITVEILEDKSQNETKNNKQIVRDVEAPDDVKAENSEDPLAFLSGQLQRVKKQTQAARSGLTKNRSSQGNQVERPSPSRSNSQSRSKSQTQNQSRSESQTEAQSDRGPELDPRKPGSLEAFTPRYRKTPALPQKSDDLENGISTVGEALPQEITVGSFTALNTDRYLYYSFFSRIEELIRYRWEDTVRETIDSTPSERLLSNTNGVWTTQLEIRLKPNGELHSTQLLKEAGYRGFDQAAIQAFAQARLFPNPPEEMIEEDGLIHLKYSFQVRYEPKVLVRSSD